MKCPRCQTGTILTNSGDATCFACGYYPGSGRAPVGDELYPGRRKNPANGAQKRQYQTIRRKERLKKVVAAFAKGETLSTREVVERMGLSTKKHVSVLRWLNEAQDESLVVCVETRPKMLWTLP